MNDFFFLEANDSVADLILSYNRANRAVAILCNHQRSVPKTFAKSMENMQTKIQQKKEQITEAEKELKEAKSELKNQKTVAAKKYKFFFFGLNFRFKNFFFFIENLNKKKKL